MFCAVNIVDGSQFIENNAPAVKTNGFSHISSAVCFSYCTFPYVGPMSRCLPGCTVKCFRNTMRWLWGTVILSGSSVNMMQPVPSCFLDCAWCCSSIMLYLQSTATVCVCFETKGTLHSLICPNCNWSFVRVIVFEPVKLDFTFYHLLWPFSLQTLLVDNYFSRVIFVFSENTPTSFLTLQSPKSPPN